MKKRLVAYLMVSALAVAVFAGCRKEEAGDAADAAATAVEEAVEAGTAAEAAVEDVAAAAETAEAAAIAGTSDAAEAAEIASAEDESVAEFVDEAEAPAEDAAAEEEAPAEGEYLVVEPGTTYTVRFGGYIYSSPEENDANIMYVANPGDYLNVVERLDNFWYKVTYYLAGEGIEHTGYIQIQ